MLDACAEVSRGWGQVIARPVDQPQGLQPPALRWDDTLHTPAEEHGSHPIAVAINSLGQPVAWRYQDLWRHR